MWKSPGRYEYYGSPYLEKVLDTRFVNYRSTYVTPDSSEALRQLEMTGAQIEGLRIRFQGVPRTKFSWQAVQEDPGPTGMPPHLSMRITGREFYLSVEKKGVEDPMEKLSLLWSIAVPLGFVPWMRYPVPCEKQDQVFHYLGPWAEIGDYLQGGGRGDLAWPSIVSAAQCEVGRWEGPKLVERTVQTHLHRLGIHSGPVDGYMGDSTLSAIRALGLGGATAQEAIEILIGMKTPPSGEPGKPRVGYISMGDSHLEAFCSGGVEATKTRQGYTIVHKKAGKLILIFGRDP